MRRSFPFVTAEFTAFVALAANSGPYKVVKTAQTGGPMLPHSFAILVVGK
jgi:hypothetical protein